MTIGEIMFRLALAMFGLGHWGCLLLGAVIGVSVVLVPQKVRARRARRTELRERAAWSRHVDDATSVLAPALDATRVEPVAPMVQLRTAVPCERPDGYRTGRANVGGRG